MNFFFYFPYPPLHVKIDFLIVHPLQTQLWLQSTRDTSLPINEGLMDIIMCGFLFYFFFVSIPKAVNDL